MFFLILLGSNVDRHACHCAECFKHCSFGGQNVLEIKDQVLKIILRNRQTHAHCLKKKKENLVELWHTSVSTVSLLSCHFSNYTIAL